VNCCRSLRVLFDPFQSLTARAKCEHSRSSPTPSFLLTLHYPFDLSDHNITGSEHRRVKARLSDLDKRLCHDILEEIKHYRSLLSTLKQYWYAKSDANVFMC